ncbi:MAG TPA: HisA/HisF-related TIM barrel protein [Candidatus Baltobacteraceae bacterium]|jgi:phosphoribosylformimino-5-aminoimidazole carboxamide ribotide isomerase|nr:HisA/HisF-related TIM barrel protein [Candidatus Baltobacteraceae bacterium]
MLIVPAIDVRGGKCVRMQRGDPSSETTYGSDPVQQAREFVAQGARQLHVIDLDAAFGAGENTETIAAICRAVDVPIQTGGGIRTLTQAQARLDAGAAYVILGTVLVEEERIARNIIHELGDRVFAGIDAWGDLVSVRGWQDETRVNRDALVNRVVQWGASRVIFTEISRDGTGEGYDLEAIRRVAEAAGPARVSVSGGARTLDHLQALFKDAPENVDACVVGRALYEGTITLSEALALEA